MIIAKFKRAFLTVFDGFFNGDREPVCIKIHEKLFILYRN